MPESHRRRQRAHDERVLAALSEPLTLYYLCRKTRLRAWQATSALDRLIEQGRVVDAWGDEAPQPRRWYSSTRPGLGDQP